MLVHLYCTCGHAEEQCKLQKLAPSHNSTYGNAQFDNSHNTIYSPLSYPVGGSGEGGVGAGVVGRRRGGGGVQLWQSPI